MAMFAAEKLIFRRHTVTGPPQGPRGMRTHSYLWSQSRNKQVFPDYYLYPHDDRVAPLSTLYFETAKRHLPCSPYVPAA